MPNFPNDSDFESKFTFESEANPLEQEPPFHLLLLGNWSGNGSLNDISQRRPVVINRDNFEAVMQRLDVGLRLDLQGDGTKPLELKFSGLDDFHPDNLFRQLSTFDDLRDVRRRLLNSDGFDRAAGEVRSWFRIPEESEPVNTEFPPQPASAENLLDSILSQPSESASAVKTQRTENTELGRLISKVVSPYLVKIDENEQSKLVAAVDEATSQLMRKILHHPQFQELESSWRALYFLARRIETDTDLKLFILNVSKEELSDNLKQAASLADSELYRWLIGETIETPGGETWALVCGNYSFGLNVDDVATLMRLAKLSAAAEIPFVSHIQPAIFGFSSFAQFPQFSALNILNTSTETKLWSTLREIPESEYLGLSPMRLLARLPYGETTSATEAFVFEEFVDETPHEQYLWMNPCFALALLAAMSFRAYGWEMGRNFQRDIEGLPMHIFKQDGETQTVPCAEVVLTESASEKFLEQGMMPFLSYRDSDRVRLARLQSISNPLKKLAGKWSESL